MAKITPIRITEQFDRFLRDLKESFWGDLYGQTRLVWKKFWEAQSSRERDSYMKTSWYDQVEPSQRIDYRNGFYERDYVTRLGTIRLRIARTRGKNFLPKGLSTCLRLAACAAWPILLLAQSPASAPVAPLSPQAVQLSASAAARFARLWRAAQIAIDKLPCRSIECSDLVTRIRSHGARFVAGDNPTTGELVTDLTALQKVLERDFGEDYKRGERAGKIAFGLAKNQALTPDTSSLSPDDETGKTPLETCTSRCDRAFGIAAAACAFFRPPADLGCLGVAGLLYAVCLAYCYENCDENDCNPKPCGTSDTPPCGDDGGGVGGGACDPSDIVCVCAAEDDPHSDPRCTFNESVTNPPSASAAAAVSRRLAPYFSPAELRNAVAGAARIIGSWK